MFVVYVQYLPIKPIIVVFALYKYRYAVERDSGKSTLQNGFCSICIELSLSCSKEKRQNKVG
jgi:hypothetical protein